MNALLWFLQFALVLLYLAGGAYKMFSSGEMATQMHALPRLGWAAVGVYEMVGALLLAIPAVAKWLQPTIAVVAMALALESFGLAFLYAHYSHALAATNPMPWSIAIGLLAALLAWGRSAQQRRG
jgi:hypothetical protein